MTAPSVKAIETIVWAGCRAPSIHNSQPWSWRFDGTGLHLYADWSRQVRRGDPDGRDLLISCGAALHHAVVAAAAQGWHARVVRTPDLTDLSHVATLFFSRQPVTLAAQAMHEAIFQRRTDRRTPAAEPVPEEQLDDLVRVGARHGTIVTPLRAKEDLSLAKDLRQLSVLLQHDDAYMEELERWTHSQGRDGVPDGSVVGSDDSRSRFSAATRFPAGVLRDTVPEGEPSPSWILLSTSSDDTLSRIRAGESLSAILLKATSLRLNVVPYTQAVEIDVTRELLEERILAGGGSLQLILRVANPQADQRTIPRTPRRELKDVLQVTTSPDHVGA